MVFENFGEPSRSCDAFAITISAATGHGNLLVRLTCVSNGTRYLREHLVPGGDVAAQAGAASDWATVSGFEQESAGWHVSETGLWGSNFTRVLTASR